ncbi:MAG: DUF559 domain-containing protein [Nitrosomonadales bacterium]|nr:DUF559 domain-containing protein [Nitrosomonadales bacterium]
MQPYDKKLKPFSRALRVNMTDAEQCLWQRLRYRQIAGVQFYRQKPLLGFIVDFYCPRVLLVVELDGSQHFAPEHLAKDAERDARLTGMGMKVLRFDDGQVLRETEAVMGVIYDEVVRRLRP